MYKIECVLLFANFHNKERYLIISDSEVNLREIIFMNKTSVLMKKNNINILKS